MVTGKLMIWGEIPLYLYPSDIRLFSPFPLKSGPERVQSGPKRVQSNLWTVCHIQ